MQCLIDADRECKTCGETKPIEDFPKHKESKGGYRSVCKACCYLKQEEWRKANLDRVRARNRKQHREKKRKAVEKFGGKCNNCGGEFHQSVFEFHHLDPAQKDFSPANARSWKQMESELDKCVMLCANCHRLAHYAIEEGYDSSKEGIKHALSD